MSKFSLYKAYHKSILLKKQKAYIRSFNLLTPHNMVNNSRYYTIINIVIIHYCNIIIFRESIYEIKHND